TYTDELITDVLTDQIYKKIKQTIYEHLDTFDGMERENYVLEFSNITRMSELKHFLKQDDLQCVYEQYKKVFIRP
ncbi:hypothetical protein V7101_10255, partial [Bacillus velezensis]|uniref:hypothetical protein n=1 Tax=Bacillus velezensis TaxID=492670 RepID=UPI002FFE1A47